MNATRDDDTLDDPTTAEDFLDFFGIPYERRVVEVNRLHILQRYHDYLAHNPAPDDEAARTRHCRDFLARAYSDFAQSDAVTEKVFAVFRKAAGTAFVPLASIGRARE